MPWYLYLALKQLFPTGRRFPFFTVVSVCGVMLGVMLLIVVLSVMNGFGQEFRAKIVDTSGHIRVQTGDILYEPDRIIRQLEEMPEVAAAAPVAEGMVMLQVGNRPAFPMVRGIDVQRGERVVPMERFLVAGELADLDDDSIFISSELAMSVGARVGDQVDLYSPLLLEKLKRDELLLPRDVRVAGLFHTGWSQVDANTVITTLRLMQDLYGLEQGVHGVALRLEPGYDADEVAQAINRTLPAPFQAVSWLDLNRDFLFVLQLEKNVLFFLLLAIVLVAAFAITSSLLIAVVRKTKEIGLLAAMGATSRQVAGCFCLQGLAIGLCGTAFGVGLAMLLLQFRNELILGFARLTQSEAALVRFYQFSEVPVAYSRADLTTIVVSAILISTLAGLIPAWKAARLRPAEALRSE